MTFGSERKSEAGSHAKSLTRSELTRDQDTKGTARHVGHTNAEITEASSITVD